MTEIFKMPDIGEGMAEGEIANWLVKVGDDVKADDAVAEVQMINYCKKSFHHIPERLLNYL